MHSNLNTKYYFISKFDTKNIDKLDKQTVVIYRNYSAKTIQESLILKIKNYCQKKGLKIILSNNVKMAIKLKLNGAYIPSFNKGFSHLSYNLKNNFKIFGSAHNIKEIRIKELQKVQGIFISSIFKKNQNYLGLNKFKIISNYTKKNTVALGGITKKNLKKLNLVKISGFAGISYFT